MLRTRRDIESNQIFNQHRFLLPFMLWPVGSINRTNGHFTIRWLLPHLVSLEGNEIMGSCPHSSFCWFTCPSCLKSLIYFVCSVCTISYTPTSSQTSSTLCLSCQLNLSSFTSTSPCSSAARNSTWFILSTYLLTLFPISYHHPSLVLSSCRDSCLGISISIEQTAIPQSLNFIKSWLI